MSRVPAVAASFTALGIVAASLAPAWPIPKGDLLTGKGHFGAGSNSSPVEGKSDYGPAPTNPDPTMPSRPPGRQPVEDIASERLSVDAARRAVDAFVAVRDNYTADGIENYGSLEEFVAETEAGRWLEAEIRTYGFTDISDWNLTITAVGSAYSAIIYDYATDLRQQIDDVRSDHTLDDEMRARLIAGLTALLPSRHNRTVVQSLFDDPIYREKLRLLEEEE